MPSMPAPRCEYRLIEHDIHYLHFCETSYAAVDEWAAYVDVIFAETPGWQIIRMLQSFVRSTPPVNYYFQRTRQLLLKYPERAKVRTAILQSSDLLTALMQSTVRVLPRQNDQVHFFRMEHRDQAIAWLLADD